MAINSYIAVHNTNIFFKIYNKLQERNLLDFERQVKSIHSKVKFQWPTKATI